MLTGSERRPGDRGRWSGASLASLLCGLALILAACTSPAAQPEPAPHSHNGAPWRIAYYEGGPFANYANALKGFADGLASLGWLEPLAWPQFEDPDDSRAIWDYLVAQANNEYIEFVPDAYWSADWQDDQRVTNQAAALQRLAQPGEIDFVLAMGTWAGQDLANDQHATPTLVITSSGPVAAGIIESVEDSGREHVIAEVDPARYLRQIRLFHEIVGFEKLGVVLEDSPNGRIYANLNDLQTVGSERGFEVVTCFAPETNITEAEALRNVSECYASLAQQVEALWIGVHVGENTKFMPDLLTPLYENQVATWAQVGSDAVRRGVLLSIARADFRAAGVWYARIAVQVFNGAKPRDLSQIYEQPNRIVLNRAAAELTGFELPPGLVEAADQVFDTIAGGE